MPGDAQPVARAVSTGAPVAAPDPGSPQLPGAETPRSDESTTQPERERWGEALRELEAAKERAIREGERAKQEAQAELISKLFPVLDGLDRSLASGAATNGLIEGVRLVRAELARVLSDFGVDRIDAVGQPFDPRQHEAIDVVAVDTPAAHDRVVEQWEAGYRHTGRVLRPAKVRVGKLSR